MRSVARIARVVALVSLGLLQSAHGSRLVELHLASLKKIDLVIIINRFDGQGSASLETSARTSVAKALAESGLEIVSGSPVHLQIYTAIVPNGCPGERHRFALTSMIELREAVRLIRKKAARPPEDLATTWREKSRIDFADEDHLDAVEKEQILDLVYLFSSEREQAIEYAGN